MHLLQSSITADAYTAALQELHQCISRLSDPEEWHQVSIHAQDSLYGTAPMLRIRRGTESQTSNSKQLDLELDEKEALDVDHEAVVKPSLQKSPVMVVYDIVYSPTYMVPILYLTIKQPLDQPRMSLDEIYESLVPAVQRDHLRSVVPMGSLSMTEHPLTGLRAYFIHPCRTQEAMAAVAGGRELAPIQYLTLWLGLVGPTVGLSLPIEVAADLAAREDRS